MARFSITSGPAARKRLHPTLCLPLKLHPAVARMLDEKTLAKLGAEKLA